MEENITFSLIFFWLGFSLVYFIVVLKNKIAFEALMLSKEKRMNTFTRLMLCGVLLTGAIGMVELIMLRGGAKETPAQISVLGMIVGLWIGNKFSSNPSQNKSNSQDHQNKKYGS